jgi:hypothetical protein
MTFRTLHDRLTDYLVVGGLFNPELMDHDKVRDLLMECRTTLLLKDAALKSVIRAYRLPEEEYAGDCRPAIEMCEAAVKL